MKKLLGLVLSLIIWTQAAPDLPTANSYTYKTYFDGSSTGTIVTATCSGTTTITCQATYNGPTDGKPHTVIVSTQLVGGPEAFSAPLNFPTTASATSLAIK